MKKVILLLLTVLLVVTMLFGCAGKPTGEPVETENTEGNAKTDGSENDDTNEVEGSENGDTDEPDPGLDTEYVEWSCLIQEFVNAPTTDDQLFFQGLKDKFNVQLRLEVVNAADFPTKLNLALASDDPPNLINGPPGSVNKYYDSGVFAELTPYLEQYAPDYLAEINKDPAVVKNVKDDKGRIFFFTRIYWDYEYPYLAMNIGMLDDLGVKVPTTTDEFYNALKAMHTADPKVTFARGQWHAGAHSLQTPIYLAYGTSNNWEHFKEGEYIFGPYERKDEMKEALILLNKMYSEGLIDPDFLTTDQDTYMAKFADGKVGAVYGWLGGQMWEADENGAYRPDSEYDWKVLPALKGPEGHQYSGVMSIGDYGMFVTKSHPDVPRAVHFLNYPYTDEGKEFCNWGIEGETYTKDADGNKELTEAQLKHELGRMNGMRAHGFYPAIYYFVSDFEFYKYCVPETMIKGIEANRPYRMVVTPNLTGTEAENDRIAQIGVDITSLIDQTLPKFVTGEMDINTEYDDYIAQLEKMGIEEYIQIYKDMYDRWMAR